MRNLKIVARWLACFLVAPMALCYAQSWPSKAVHIVVSFPPGTGGDVIARMIQPSLQAAWGQAVVIDNKAGATGNIGAGEVARATDDHTLLVGPDTMATVNPHLYHKLTFKPRQDLQFVTYLASFSQTLVCHLGAKVNTLSDFLKQGPGTSYASGGVGSPSQMSMEMLLAAAHVKMSNIPYRGPPPAVQDVLAGQVACGFLPTINIAPYVKTGKLKAIAISGRERSPTLPDVPTVAEGGFPGFDATFFETMMAPAGLPPAILEKVQRDVRQALNEPKVKQQLLDMELRVVANSPQEAAVRSAADYEKWGVLARGLKLQLD